MATIREYIEATIPESYRLVTQGLTKPDGSPTSSWDGKDRIDIFRIEIDRAMSVLFKPNVTEENLSEIAKSYTADTVTYRTIVGLIDYYMVKTRLNDSMGRAGGTVPLGGESSTNYNRVETLEKQSQAIARRLLASELDFAADAASLLRTSGSRAALGARISSSGNFRTDDPQFFPGTMGYPLWLTTGLFGVPVIQEIVIEAIDRPPLQLSWDLI